MSFRSKSARRCVALPVPAALLAAVMLSTGTPASAPGRVVGRVRLVAADAGRAIATSYGSRRVTQAGQPGRDIRNVVVYLQGVKGGAVTPRQHEMRQQDEVFVPRVLPIARGSTVAFPNGDPYFHNVFSLSRAASFDLGRYPPGQSRVRTFNTPGLVKVFCHLHSHMSGSILVFDHSWFTTPGDDGTFVIDDVPPGHRTVTAWHERIGEARTSVTVPPGGEVAVEFVLPVVEP